MPDSDVVVVNGGKAGWFLAGAVVVAAAVALFLYSDGYFSQKDTLELKIDIPKVEIDGG
jgi:hypothetical protein